MSQTIVNDQWYTSSEKFDPEAIRSPNSTCKPNNLELPYLLLLRTSLKRYSRHLAKQQLLSSLTHIQHTKQQQT